MAQFSPTRSISGTLATGAIAILPVAITVAAVVWLAGLLLDAVGPDSALGAFLASIGLTLSASPAVAYLLGVLILLIVLYTLGFAVQARFTSRIRTALDGAVRRVPLVGPLYGFSSQFVGMLRPDESADLTKMQPVWVCTGEGGEATVLALMPTSETISVDGLDRVGVLIPMAPVPFGGVLLFVPRSWIVPARLSVEQLTSIYLSMGLTAPDMVSDPDDAR